MRASVRKVLLEQRIEDVCSEVPREPRWPKMRLGSHLELHLQTSWGSPCRQDGGSWVKNTLRWHYVGKLGRPDGQLGSILGGILAFFFNLERDLS